MLKARPDPVIPTLGAKFFSQNQLGTPSPNHFGSESIVMLTPLDCFGLIKTTDVGWMRSAYPPYVTANGC